MRPEYQGGAMGAGQKKSPFARRARGTAQDRAGALMQGHNAAGHCVRDAGRCWLFVVDQVESDLEQLGVSALGLLEGVADCIDRGLAPGVKDDKREANNLTIAGASGEFFQGGGHIGSVLAVGVVKASQAWWHSGFYGLRVAEIEGHMKKLLMGLSFLALLAASQNVLADEIPPELRKSIYNFKLLNATLEQKVLRLVVDRPVVNQEVYKLVVTQGVCLPIWDKDSKGWQGAKIERVEVLNRVQGQGFALLGGRKACDDLANLVSQTPAHAAYFAANTWVCVAGNACRPRRPGEVTSGDQ